MVTLEDKILTCPACSTRYSTDAKDFPPEGRDVRCARCGHVWHQEAPVEDPDPGIFENAPSEAETADDIRRSMDDEAEAAIARRQARLRETAPPKKKEDKPRTPSRWRIAAARAILGVGWLGIVVLVLSVGWATLAFRPILTAYWPQSASLYATIGIKPDIAALKFSDVGYRAAIADGQPILTVSGRLVNDGGKEQSVPLIRAALIDAGRREVYHWTFAPKVLTLAPGQSTQFVTKVSSPPSAAKNLELHFAKTGE